VTRYPIVSVEWKDAYVTQDENDVETVAALHGYARIVTVGFLIRKTRDAVYVAQDWCPEGSVGLDNGRPVWRGITVVPRSLIVKQTLLRKGSE
jgi:uncharacterized protein YdeI (BOF family)